ncbi:MAG: T9SS type A sorting domain-containing protein [Bacteroidales bacterium]|nr:T9SS type A sorting domain-containing protein [Bacteroidales bacterium]
MKKLFTLIFVIAAVAASAQSLSLKFNGEPVHINDTLDIPAPSSTTVNSYIEYANTSSNGVFFKVKKEELSVSDDAQTTFCIGGSCYAGNLSQELYIDENAVVTIDDETNVFHATFCAGTSGTNLVKYTFYNTENEGDAVSFVFRYNVTTGVADVAAANVLRAYPNPAVSNVTFEYNASNLANANLVIRNLTGAVVYKAAVQGKGKIQMSDLKLKAGVYFYGLESDGKVIVSKKLLVK